MSESGKVVILSTWNDCPVCNSEMILEKFKYDYIINYHLGCVKGCYTIYFKDLDKIYFDSIRFGNLTAQRFINRTNFFLEKLFSIIEFNEVLSINKCIEKLKLYKLIS